MKRVLTMLLAALMIAALAVPATALDYGLAPDPDGPTQAMIDAGLLPFAADSLAPATRRVALRAAYVLAGSPEGDYPDAGYADVDPDDPDIMAVNWAAAYGIMRGYGNGKLGLDDLLSEAQAAVIMLRTAAHIDGGASWTAAFTGGYTNVDEIPEWALGAVAWCVEKGVLPGGDHVNAFDGDGICWIPDLARMLEGFLARKG